MSLPKSTSMKLWEGHVNKQELKPNPTPTNAPRKPRGLGREAERLWKTLVPQLETLNLATAIDEATLIGLCEWWGAYVKARDGLNKVDDLSTLQGMRALNATKTTWSEFRRLAELFGLTPCSRSGIHVETKSSADDDLSALKL
jgi:P27 family predicted phage terminase small subunit